METATKLPADKLALDLAQQELERIGRIWIARKLPVSLDRPLHAHLTAIATLCGGLSADEAHQAIVRESGFINQKIMKGDTELAKSALHAAIPGELGGLSSIQPDILGAAVLLAVWENDLQSQKTVRRCFNIFEREVASCLLRAARDFPNNHEVREWLVACSGTNGEMNILRECLTNLDAGPFYTTFSDGRFSEIKEDLSILLQSTLSSDRNMKMLR
jgi:hypothetical protein